MYRGDFKLTKIVLFRNVFSSLNPSHVNYCSRMNHLQNEPVNKYYFKKQSCTSFGLVSGKLTIGNLKRGIEIIVFFNFCAYRI